MGWREASMMRRQVRSVCGQDSGGPSGVDAQSKARMAAPISPPPARKSGAAGMVLWICRFILDASPCSDPSRTTSQRRRMYRVPNRTVFGDNGWEPGPYPAVTVDYSHYRADTRRPVERILDESRRSTLLLPGPSLPGGARLHRGAGRAPVGGGLHHPVHARCQSGEMASRPYELVL